MMRTHPNQSRQSQGVGLPKGSAKVSAQRPENFAGNRNERCTVQIVVCKLRTIRITRLPHCARSRASTVLNPTSPPHRFTALDDHAVSTPMCLYMQRDERAPLLSDGQWASLAAALRIDEICAMVVVGDIPFVTDSIYDARAKAQNASQVSHRAQKTRAAMGCLTRSSDGELAVEISRTA